MGIRVSCAGVVLAGGLNTRMGRRNKAFLDLGGRSFLDWILAGLAASFTERLIVTREPSLYDGHQARVVEDIFDVRSPLTGIHAALVEMGSDYAFVTSCDTPLLSKDVIRVLKEAIEPDADVIAPFDGTYYQPMCAIYSRRCIPLIENMLVRREKKVDLFYPKVRLKTIPYERLRAVDPELHSFFNVNTRAELETARRLFAG
jgi:molybdopterin-guanine dinucleotide biosynthesis protein A